MRFRAELLLLLTAAIWGTGFVAQRMGMDHVGPFTFNGVRFALGSLTLLPLVPLSRRPPEADAEAPAVGMSKAILRVLLVGLVLFSAVSLQQVGMIHTTAGNGGFITGLYVVLVPMMGLVWGQRTSSGTWIGAVLAVSGLFMLSVRDGLSMNRGDVFVLGGAFLWAAHVLLIGWLAPRISPIRLAASQFAVCSALSLLAAACFEKPTFLLVKEAAGPILYGGILSVGIAYTLQVVAQATARPAHSAVIMSLEGAFAALGGWFVLGEVLDVRGFAGCALMAAGMIVSQIAHGRSVSRFPENAARSGC